MRSEKEMYDLILGYANADENIRAVILNGSRANPNRKPDPFNDFDIVYLVRDLTPCKEKAYYKDFGEILVCERTDENELFKEHFPEFVCYLMQFADGNRIDLTVSSIDRWEVYCYDDRLSVVLLDKDNALPKLPEPNESTHYVKKPTARMFFDCRTEFWWVSPYVSKGLWRSQLLFAQTHMESCIRKMLLQMMKWYAGTLHGFDYSAGKCGDALKDLLPADTWNGYLETFAACTEEDIWRETPKRWIFILTKRKDPYMQILCIGDVVGSHGCDFLRRTLPAFKRTKGIDVVIANGENSSDGNGITPASANHLLDSGVDIITTGNHTYRRREFYDYIDESDCVIRPANFPPEAPGKGMTVLDLGRTQIAVINLMGIVYLDEHLACPFRTLDTLLKTPDLPKICIVDFHAEATGEKRAFGYYADGRVSAVFGTHTHVQTADETVLPKGTGYITDVGMTGPIESVLGVRAELVIKKQISKMPVRFDFADGPCKLDCILFDIDEKTGLTRSTERFSLR